MMCGTLTATKQVLVNWLTQTALIPTTNQNESLWTTESVFKTISLKSHEKGFWNVLKRPSDTLYHERFKNASTGVLERLTGM